MRPELETYHQIDLYLEGKLTGDDLLSFENKIKEDPSFAGEIEHQKLVNEVIQGAQLGYLRDKIKQDIAAMDGGGKIPGKWVALTVAGILSVASLTYYLNTRQEKSEAGQAKVATEIKDTQPQLRNAGPEADNMQPQPSTRNKTDQASAQKGAPAGTNSPEIISSPIDTGSFTTENKVTENVRPENTADKSASLPPAASTHSPAVSGEKSNCDNVKIFFTPVTRPTCQGSSEGSITIGEKNIHGGTSPYTFEIQNHNATAFSGTFTGLAEGKYVVTVKDHSGCVSEKEVIIHEKICETARKLLFNPDLGETCPIPFRESGTLSIYNKGGMLIFKADLGHAGTFEWNGADMRGEIVPAGMYVFVLEYADGSKEKGQITASR